MTKPFLTKSFKASLIDDNTVEGYASTYGNLDHANDIVEKGAFTKTLQQNGGKIKFLWQHDIKQPIGVIEELRDTAQGLYFKARFSNSTAGQDARTQLKEGVVDSFSIGYRVINATKDRAGNGRPINRLTELALHEISVVTIPCNDEAVLLGVKSALHDDFPEMDADAIDALYDEYVAFREMKSAQIGLETKFDVDATDEEIALELGIALDETEEEEAETAETDEPVDEQKSFNEALKAKMFAYQLGQRIKSRNQ